MILQYALVTLLHFGWQFGAHADDAKLIAPRISGDIRLLDILRDTQLANEKNCTRGSLTATVETVAKDKQSARNVKCKVDCKWDGRQFRSELTGTYDDRNIRIVDRNGVRMGDSNSKRRSTFVTNGELILTHDIDAKHATLDKLEIRSPALECLVRPQDWWFGRISGERRPWIEYMGPHPNTPQDGIREFKVASRAPDLIELTVRGEKGASVTVVASLAMGGNIVEASSDTPAQKLTTKAAYSWNQDQAGRYVLASCHFVLAHGGSVVQKTYIVEHVDFDAKLPADTFSVDPTSLPDGTFVENKIMKRNLRVGRVRRGP